MVHSLKKHGIVFLLKQFTTVGTTVVSFHVTLLRLPHKMLITPFKFNDLLTCIYSELDTDQDIRLTVREFVDMDKNVETGKLQARTELLSPSQENLATMMKTLVVNLKSCSLLPHLQLHRHEMHLKLSLDSLILKVQLQSKTRLNCLLSSRSKL